MRVEEPTLAVVMRRVGERVSFTAAVAICWLSVVALAIVLAFGASHWRVALLLVATGMFGVWTLADHERRDGRIPEARRWHLLQGVSGAVGMAAVFILFLAFLGSALGLWIS
jgi:hypothetical protein